MASGAVELADGGRQGDAGGAQGEAGGGARRRAQEKAFAVLLDLGLGQRVEIGDECRARNCLQVHCRARPTGPAFPCRRYGLPAPSSGRGRGSCRRRGREWSRRACERSAAWRTGSSMCGTPAPPSISACSKAWRRAARGRRIGSEHEHAVEFGVLFRLGAIDGEMVVVRASPGTGDSLCCRRGSCRPSSIAAPARPGSRPWRRRPSSSPRDCGRRCSADRRRVTALAS